MSIIGPRPLPVFIYERMSDRHQMRSAVRPGLECPRVIELDYEDTCKYQRCLLLLHREKKIRSLQVSRLRLSLSI